MKFKFPLLPFAFALFFSFTGRAQLVVTNTAPYNSINYLVQNVFLGTGVQASNITYTGSPLAIGYFNGVNSNLNIDSGIVITSGDIMNAVGPNNTGSSSSNNALPGDLQLEQITNNTANGSFDASAIEFDFLASSDTIQLEYVFGSEEYMEYVNTGFNDAFAFIISGVSVALPPTNIALIPSPPAPLNTPVTIDNVNLGSYPQYYFDNGNGQGTGTAPDGLTVQYDGFTTVLTAIYPVQCGQTYHIKIVIADVLDHSFDSGVFLKARSFSASGFTLSANISYGSLNDSTLYEGCGQACVVVGRGGINLSNPDTVLLSLSGTAINGVDITQLPDTIFFLPGQDSAIVCINALVDALPEGPETLNLLGVLMGSNACSVNDSISLVLYIDDHIPLSVASNGDTSVCPGNSATIYAGISNGVQPYVISWSPVQGLSCTTCPSPVASPAMTTTYTVSVTDSCNAVLQTDTVTVTILSVPTISIAGSSTLCTGQSTSLTASGGTSYIWNTGATTTSILVSPPSSTSYTVTGSNGQCNNTTTFSLNVIITPSVSISSGTSICQGNPITLNATSSTGNYSWNTGAVTNSIIVSPNSTTTYFVHDSNACGSDTDSVAITVYPTPTITVTGNSLVCTGQSATLTASGGTSYVWNTGASSSSIAVSPTSNTIYSVTGYNAQCNSMATFSVSAVITPSLSASADTTICPGTSINLAATSATGNYSWSTGANTSFITVSPTSTTIYSVNDSNVCGSDNETIIVTVLPPGPIMANSSDHTVCLGNPVTLSTIVAGGANPYSYQWITVSGNDSVPSPTFPNSSLLPTGTGVYNVTVNDFCGNTDTELVYVYVEDCITIIPNVISADGNGQNDYFVIKNLNKFPNSRLVIYDRWGVKILDNPDYKNNWDAHGYSDGTYYYVLYRSDGMAFPGFITVLRH